MKKILEQMRNISLKSKWTMTVGATIFISYALISIILYIALQTWLINNEEKNAMRTVDDITTFFEAQGNAVTIQQLQNNNALMKAIMTQEQTVRIFNLDGVEVIRINDANMAAPIPKQTSNRFSTIINEEKIGDTNAFVIHQVVQIGPFQGIMQLIHPLTTFQSMMKYILTTILIVGFGALLFSVSMSYYLANLLIKPLVQLRDAMNTVKNQGFSAQQVIPYKADDEIGDVLKMYRSLMKELEISFTRQQQFIADASHELRTPVQVIEGHLSLIKRWGKDEPEVLEESLNTSLEEITRMKKLIEELLQLARQEEVDEYAHADIHRVIENVKKEVTQLNPNADINVIVIGQPNSAKVTEHAAEQIIRNIINNGIRYNENNPIIDVKITYESEQIVVQIQDNGIGIAKEQLPYIFDRFYRVEESRTKEIAGTGLGLSITKMLAEKYNIKMLVESELNKGTAFMLYFSVR